MTSTSKGAGAAASVPPTPAELLGLTSDLARRATAMAAAQLQIGDLDSARTILEGLAIANPYDPAPWVLLAAVERRRGKLLAARVCAETASRLAPGDRQVRLTRAEVNLAHAEAREGAVVELGELRIGHDAVAQRAAALLVALGGD